MPINGVSSVSTPQSAPANSLTDRTAIDRQLFLRLLVAQLANQDPLNPVAAEDFTTQLAQLTTLETIQQLNANVRDLLLLQGLGQSANLIGKTIRFPGTGGAGLQTGLVTAVTIDNGRILLTVGEQLVPLDQVRGIQSGQP